MIGKHDIVLRAMWDSLDQSNICVAIMINIKRKKRFYVLHNHDVVHQTVNFLRT